MQSYYGELEKSHNAILLRWTWKVTQCHLTVNLKSHTMPYFGELEKSHNAILLRWTWKVTQCHLITVNLKSHTMPSYYGELEKPHNAILLCWGKQTYFISSNVAQWHVSNSCNIYTCKQVVCFTSLHSDQILVWKDKTRLKQTHVPDGQACAMFIKSYRKPRGPRI
jgi:hypothetical protein